MVRQAAFAIFRIFFRVRYGWKTNVHVGKGIQYFRSSLSAHPGSTVKIGKNVKLIDAVITVGPGSVLSVGDHSVLKNVILTLSHGSVVEMQPGAVLNYSHLPRGVISISQGQLSVGEKANLKADITVRFGGSVSLGLRTGIGYGSEIVCDERVHLGDYCLVSNYVSIYDTNSHSVHFQERRERIEVGYPDGCSEVEKPGTAPILIGNDVWIGKNATILKGVTIGDRCIVGMATTVTKGTYPDGSNIVSDKPRVIN